MFLIRNINESTTLLYILKMYYQTNIILSKFYEKKLKNHKVFKYFSTIRVRS